MMLISVSENSELLERSQVDRNAFYAARLTNIHKEDLCV